MEPQNLTPSLNGLASLSSSLVALLWFALLGRAMAAHQGQSSERLVRLASGTALAVAGGAGLWACHHIVLGGLTTVWPLNFSPSLLVLSGGLAIAGMAGLLSAERSTRGTPWSRVGVQAGGLGLLWALLQLLGLISLTPSPLTPWWPALATGALMGLAGLAALSLLRAPAAQLLAPFEVRLWAAASLFGLMNGLSQEVMLSLCRFADFTPASGAPPGTGGAEVWLLCGASTLILALGLFGAFVDARARLRQADLTASLDVAHERLREQALADPLTGLPNRLLFEERLAQRLMRVPSEATDALAVMFIDLDGFKPVNDSFGHAAGDAVLAEVGRRLAQVCGAQDLAARVGGDEFLLLIDLEDGHGAGRASVLAQAVLRAICLPYQLPNRMQVNLSCSVGIVTYPAHGPGSKLIANADAAMYAAKRAGGSTFAFFEPSMDQDARLQLALQHDLRHAIELHGLELFYQPKVHALSGQITGAEALVRWNHPERGMILPSVFIPVAERFGLISALGYWVIEEACRQIREWDAMGLRMRLAVNLSLQQLRQDDLVPRIRASMARHRVDPALLTFEITESVAMEDTTVRTLSALAGVGVSLSIDDFGTAYSNFAALRKLPVQQLKIDRSLFADIGQSADALAVVDAMIKMAHALSLKVVAEGVETERQRDLLLALNCDEFQGYLYARPMSARMLSLWALDEGDSHPPVDFRPSLYASADSLLH